MTPHARRLALAIAFLLPFAPSVLADSANPPAPPEPNPPAPLEPDASAPEASAPDAAVTLTVELLDGSRIIGPPVDLKSLPLKVDFGDVDIPLSLIDHAAYTKDRAAIVVKFANGDQLTGVAQLDRLLIRTAFGQASVPLSRVAKITVKTAK